MVQTGNTLLRVVLAKAKYASHQLIMRVRIKTSLEGSLKAAVPDTSGADPFIIHINRTGSKLSIYILNSLLSWSGYSDMA